MNTFILVLLSLAVIGAGCVKKPTTPAVVVETEKYSGLSVPPPPQVFADQGLPTEETEMNFDVVKTESTSTVYTGLKKSELIFTLYTHKQEWLTPASTTISVSYPLLNSAIVGGAKFSETLHQAILKEVEAFRKDILINADLAENPAPGMRNYLDVTATIVQANPKLIVAQISVNNYFTGAAHPNGYVKTINFDLNKGKDLSLDELFNTNAKYLDRLSELVRPQLVASLNEKIAAEGLGVEEDDEWLTEGTEPTTSNYQKFLLTTNGFQILFDPYQVAPYAVGPQTVVIPYTKLKEVIQPGLLEQYGLY